ncbi:MAG: hypothetical protein ACK4ND_06310 [Cytophagaceae bacterium]
MNRQMRYAYEPYMNQPGAMHHTSVQPYFMPELDTLIPADTSLYDFKSYGIGRQRFVGRYLNNLLNGHFIRVDTGDFYLTIDPLFNFQRGRDFHGNKNTWVNTRGFWVRGAIGKKFAFESSVYENQAVFVDYIDRFVRERDVVPGQGQQKRFKQDGFDYNMAMGHISYSPSQYVNFQFGHGKHFIGDGYRSLLLSDNAFAYPYLKVTTTIWKFKYTNIFSQFNNLAEQRNVLHHRKNAAIHYLSTNIGKRLQVGLYESVIYEVDSMGRRGLDVNYLNPVIFYRSVEFAVGSPDRALVGLNLKYLFAKTFWVYGQGMIDDLKISELKLENSRYRQKWGYQLGFVWLDPIGIKNLRWQSEYNQVTPYSYTHRNPIQTYSHYNQELAHPLGANFRENVNFLSYRHKRFFVEGRYSYAMYGANTPGINYGNNIFMYRGTGIPGHVHRLGQGQLTNLHHTGLTLAYIINPVTNMRFEVSYLRRIESSAVHRHQTNFFSVGLSTNLRNIYYDF